MDTIVSVPLRRGVEQRPADSVQIRPPELTPQIDSTPEESTAVFDATREAGTPDFTALIEKTERERLARLGQVRMLLGELVGRKQAMDTNKRLNDIYYWSQGHEFGFALPLDPSRVNGVSYPAPEEPKREDYKSSEEFEQARSQQADALASQEKHALSGVPFN